MLAGDGAPVVLAAFVPVGACVLAAFRPALAVDVRAYILVAFAASALAAFENVGFARAVGFVDTDGLEEIVGPNDGTIDTDGGVEMEGDRLGLLVGQSDVDGIVVGSSEGAIDAEGSSEGFSA